MRCYRKILHISYKDHVTNEEVRAKIQQAIAPHVDLLTVVKRHKLQWYGHVSRSSGLAKTILQGTVKGGRRQGRQGWEGNIREWTGLEFDRSQRAVENREKWRKLVAKSSVVPQRPSQLRNWWWWWWCSFHPTPPPPPPIYPPILGGVSVCQCVSLWCVSVFRRARHVCVCVSVCVRGGGVFVCMYFNSKSYIKKLHLILVTSRQKTTVICFEKWWHHDRRSLSFVSKTHSVLPMFVRGQKT